MFFLQKWWKYSRRDEDDSVVSPSLYSPELLTSRGNFSRSFFLLVSTVFMQSHFLRVCIANNCKKLSFSYVSSRWKFWSPRTWLWSSWGQLSWWWHMLLLSTYQQDVLIINISAEEIQHSCTAFVIWSISGRHTAPPAITTEVCDDRSQEPLFCRKTITSLFYKVTSRTHRKHWFPPQRLKWPLPPCSDVFSWECPQILKIRGPELNEFEERHWDDYQHVGLCVWRYFRLLQSGFHPYAHQSDCCHGFHGFLPQLVRTVDFVAAASRVFVVVANNWKPVRMKTVKVSPSASHPPSHHFL